MKVTVTGGAGFLGSHLVFHHLDRGDEVLCIDNFCTAMGSASDPSPHFKKMLERKNFRFLVEDVSDPTLIQRLGDWQGDVIYNFACPASPPRYQSMPIETMMTCIVGTRNMLEVARRTGAIVVHASTSEVYGDPDVSPQDESYKGCVNSYGPRSCYDEGKRAAEALCFDYLNKHSVDARLVRIFNTYGPHMDPNDGRVVSNFICQALRHEALTIYGDGLQTRSFCYVDDLIRGITAVGELGPNPGVPINLGNPHEFTIMTLSDAISARLGGRIVKRPLPIDDPTQRCPDITKAKVLLRWEPKVSLVEGLEKTIEYFRSVL